MAAEYQKLPNGLDYNQHVKPILSDKCFACHRPDKAKQKAGLRLDIAKNAYAALPETPSKVAITPKNLEKSEAFHRTISTDPTYLMPTPKSHLTFSAREKAVLIKWIEEGAVYKPHWAFVKLRGHFTSIYTPIDQLSGSILRYCPKKFVLLILKNAIVASSCCDSKIYLFFA